VANLWLLAIGKLIWQSMQSNQEANDMKLKVIQVYQVKATLKKNNRDNRRSGNQRRIRNVAKVKHALAHACA
jgi:hypothetical protein